MSQAVKLTDNRKVHKAVYELKPNIVVIQEILALNFLVLTFVIFLTSQKSR